jgi:tight adherence protein B
MAQLVGWDVVSSITQTPITGLSIAFGLVLLLGAKFVSSRFLIRAKPKDSFTGFYLLAVALEISAGTNFAHAQRRALRTYMEHFGNEPSAKELEALAEIIPLVEQAGIRVGELLRAQATNLQREEINIAEMKIEKLGIKLMIPLGLGVLPSFVLLAIVPLMVTTLGSK